MTNPTPKYPVILAHGIARFDILRFGPKGYYWHPIVSKILKKEGFQVFITDVEWAGTVKKRGKQLSFQIKTILNKTKAKKVHVIAHSMGGLDGRSAICEEKMNFFVSSLVTIGTPHLGSPVADVFVGHGVVGVVVDGLRMVLKALNIDEDGLDCLTSENCRKRNEKFREIEEKNESNIFYRFYAGKQEKNDVFHLLRPFYDQIETVVAHNNLPPGNDGVVPVHSALWLGNKIENGGEGEREREREEEGEREGERERAGEREGEGEKEETKKIIPFDHLNMLGWWDVGELDGFGDGVYPSEFVERVERFYMGIAQDLRESEFDFFFFFCFCCCFCCCLFFFN